MNRTRNHTVVVKITTNKPITGAMAVYAVNRLMGNLDLGVTEIWPESRTYREADYDHVYAERLTASNLYQHVLGLLR